MGLRWVWDAFGIVLVSVRDGFGMGVGWDGFGMSVLGYVVEGFWEG